MIRGPAFRQLTRRRDDVHRECGPPTRPPGRPVGGALPAAFPATGAARTDTVSSSDPRRSAEAERLKPEARHSADRLRAEAGAAEGLESELRTAMEERPAATPGRAAYRRGHRGVRAGGEPETVTAARYVWLGACDWNPSRRPSHHPDGPVHRIRSHAEA